MCFVYFVVPPSPPSFKLHSPPGPTRIPCQNSGEGRLPWTESTARGRGYSPRRVPATSGQPPGPTAIPAMSTEADTCRKLITPKLQVAGWDTDPRCGKDDRTLLAALVVGEGLPARPEPRTKES